jgi:hypothetical protein
MKLAWPSVLSEIGSGDHQFALHVPLHVEPFHVHVTMPPRHSFLCIGPRNVLSVLRKIQRYHGE